VKQAIDKLRMNQSITISKKMKQLVDLEAFNGVQLQDIPYTQRKKIVSSSKFLKEKYRVDGKFEIEGKKHG